MDLGLGVVKGRFICLPSAFLEDHKSLDASTKACRCNSLRQDSMQQSRILLRWERYGLGNNHAIKPNTGAIRCNRQQAPWRLFVVRESRWNLYGGTYLRRKTVCTQNAPSAEACVLRGWKVIVCSLGACPVCLGLPELSRRAT